MQKMRRGAVTLPGLSTVAVGAATPCEITGEGRDEAESENEEIIWGGRGEAREAEKQRATMGKFNKSGVNKKTFSAFWWTPGSISIASYLTQPSHTHTHTNSSITKGPIVWIRSFSTVELKGIVFEAGCHLWRIRLYWPEEMTLCAPSCWGRL